MANRSSSNRFSSKRGSSRHSGQSSGQSEFNYNNLDLSQSRPPTYSTQGLATRVSSGRLGTIFVIFLVVALIIVGRLVWLQVIDAQNISGSGDSGRSVTVDIEPRRGTIYDRNGVVLATTVDAVNVYCHPHMIPDDNKESLADKLAEVFGGEKAKYLELINKNTNFVYLYKKADTDKADQVKDFSKSVEGVGFEETSKRVYPCGATGSQIIGILNDEGRGLTGLELYYDDILGGTAGKQKTEYSKEGVPVPGSTVVESEVQNGNDIVISVDIGLQEQVEKSLSEQVEKIEGKNGSSIVMDAETGEIYACASMPLFDITDLSDIKEGATNLSGISLAYEPGSIFKPVTMLAALEEGTTALNVTYECPEYITADEYRISDAHERPAAKMTTTEIMAYSSNVGMSLIARDLTFKKLYNYIKQYELTENPNVDYPGSAGGAVSDVSEWSNVQGYNISFGQGITVTPMEMVRFYGAVANNGYANSPHFLLDTPAQKNDVTYETTEIIKNKQAIADLTSMLKAVVKEGTGTGAQVKGYEAAGKTGTAEFASASGGYEKGSYDISFVGFLPSSSLNLVCFVGAGGVPGERQTVSAFQDIMSYAVDRYGITQE